MQPTARITATVQANANLTAPGCDDLPAFHTGDAIVTTWELTPEDLNEILRTGRLHLAVYGGGHPPVLLTPYEEYVTPLVLPTAGGPAN